MLHLSARVNRCAVADARTGPLSLFLSGKNRAAGFPVFVSYSNTGRLAGLLHVQPPLPALCEPHRFLLAFHITRQPQLSMTNLQFKQNTLVLSYRFMRMCVRRLADCSWRWRIICAAMVTHIKAVQKSPSSVAVEMRQVDNLKFSPCHGVPAISASPAVLLSACYQFHLHMSCHGSLLARRCSEQLAASS